MLGIDSATSDVSLLSCNDDDCRTAKLAYWHFVAFLARCRMIFLSARAKFAPSWKPKQKRSRQLSVCHTLIKTENLSHAFYYFSALFLPFCCARFAFSCRDYLMRHSRSAEVEMGGNIYRSVLAKDFDDDTCPMEHDNPALHLPIRMEFFSLNSIVFMYRKMFLHIE